MTLKIEHLSLIKNANNVLIICTFGFRNCFGFRYSNFVFFSAKRESNIDLNA
jgi:hypothetical protein